ncbi:MAG: TRAP transporter small permease [Alphaproteobacteria bacterium]|jgi:TRAP-type transport system small permease protein|nr:TRAP transporter small permease [Alphaproteobacteria bacterium]MBU0805637.1 TRAP transporter small permease [Alphaproteobacteria bacterium]MBU0873583.1 TRAP transporter small permease [Alphaproteobacteria bacterium]MBU1401189.1 TRAP transporter small permease [Alphaproteobacteria bacterium]MBU1592394.1 TRAP transporter small permease [Alphaproteobacteria bacterium]
MSADKNAPVAESSIADLIHAEDEDLSGYQWDDSLVLGVFWALAFVVFLQFFTRYVLNNSLGWTEEIARFLLIAVTFLGAIMAVRKESHIAVELAYRWLPRRARYTLQIAIDVISIVFYGFMGFLCTQMAGKTQQMMVSINLPKSSLYWFTAACFLAMTLYAIKVAWQHLRTGTSRLIDPESAKAVLGPSL